MKRFFISILGLFIFFFAAAGILSVSRLLGKATFEPSVIWILAACLTIAAFILLLAVMLCGKKAPAKKAPVAAETTEETEFGQRSTQEQ